MPIERTEEWVHGRQREELQQAAREGLLIRDYLEADISLDEFAALMGMSPEMMGDGLRRRGIGVRRRFNDPVLEQADEEHCRPVAAELGIAVTDAWP